MGKRARDAPAGLRSSLNLRGISKAALTEVVGKLLGDERAASKAILNREADSRFQEVCHLFQLPRAQGEGRVDVLCCHPLKTLDLLLRESDSLHGVVLGHFTTTPLQRSCAVATLDRLG